VDAVGPLVDAAVAVAPNMTNEDEDFAAKWFAEWTPPAIQGTATQQLVELIDHDPEMAWTRILFLIRAAPNDFGLTCVTIPLEQLLCAHGALFIDRVEDAAARDVRFKWCLKWVCGDTRMTAAVHVRMRRATDWGEGLE